MAVSSLDDKFLGEKAEYYCSSSSEEDNGAELSSQPTPSVQYKSIPRAGKTTVQTGPKGVIEDWKHYKRLKYEEQERNAAKHTELIKKLSLTCDPNADETASTDLDGSDKEFLKWYNQKRILELQQKFASKWAGITFGKVFELTRDNYVEEIENEKAIVTIIIHIYDDNVPACEAMAGCLQILAREYRQVKFCRIKATDAELSEGFVNHGLPALLAYKNNTLLGSFVRISDTLGEDFYANDVEAYLKSYGVLPEKDLDLDEETDPDSRETDDDTD